MKLIVAFSTNDGKTLVNSHFGDASLYPIYEISKASVRFVETIENQTEQEDQEIHGDPNKAQGIAQILKPLGVQVLCGKQFGQNIKIMVKNFVPVLISVKYINEAIDLIQQNFEQIKELWIKGENRKLLRING